MTKRDLAKIGVSNIDQLEQPLPAGILIRGKLALRHDDDGNESNRLVRFECVGVEPGDAFEPRDDPAEQGNSGEPDGDFPFGGNATAGESAAPAPNDNPPADANGVPPAPSNDTPTKPKKPKKTANATGAGGEANQ